MNDLLAGAIAMGSLVIALFFLRFWHSTHDRFFLYFAMSFGLEAVGRVLLTFVYSLQDDAPVPYLMRLVAYGLILYAIWDKNRKPSLERARSTLPGN
jgi:hypothetical protein